MRTSKFLGEEKIMNFKDPFKHIVFRGGPYVCNECDQLQTNSRIHLSSSRRGDFAYSVVYDGKEVTLA